MDTTLIGIISVIVIFFILFALFVIVIHAFGVAILKKDFRKVFLHIIFLIGLSFASYALASFVFNYLSGMLG